MNFFKRIVKMFSSKKNPESNQATNDEIDILIEKEQMAPMNQKRLQEAYERIDKERKESEEQLDSLSVFDEDSPQETKKPKV